MDPDAGADLEIGEVFEAQAPVERPRHHATEEVEPGRVAPPEVLDVMRDEPASDPLAAEPHGDVHVEVGRVLDVEARGKATEEVVLGSLLEPERAPDEAAGVGV